MIKILLADNSSLIKSGFRCLLADQQDYSFIADAFSYESLKPLVSKHKPDLLIADVHSLFIGRFEIQTLKKLSPKTKILAVTYPLSKQEMTAIMSSGVTSYLLKECDKDEIIEAIYHTLKNETFLCGKISSVLTSAEEVNMSAAQLKSISCEGSSVTDREVEIIRFISEGLSNKQIADMLCLSTHTINTHRKNIMAKLGVNNTAGVVMYAVKNNLLEPNNLLFS